MPTIFSARDIAEIALQNIGAFPVADDAADPAELRRALKRLEMILNDSIGAKAVTSAWVTLVIPIVAGQSRYKIGNYASAEGVQFVYDTFLQKYDETTGLETTRDLLESDTERDFNQWDMSRTGIPGKAFIDRTNDPYVSINPAPAVDLPNGRYALRLQCQTHATKLTPQGTGNVNINFRPTYYFFITKKLSYELGSGAIRRLDERELDRFQKDYMMAEANLTGSDASQIDGMKNATDPWGQ